MTTNSSGQNVQEITPQAVLAERSRQIYELGYTAESDDDKGVDMLLVFAQQYLERGKILKGVALIQAARAAYDRELFKREVDDLINPMQADIQKFMEACDQEVKKYPEIPSEDIRNLRIKLMIEELLGSTTPTGVLVTSKSDELIQSMLNNDLVGIADGIADVLYVVIGTAVAYGINIQEVFNEVQRSNMTKAVWDDENQKWTTIKNEFGKVLKPETFSKANIHPIIVRQIEAGRSREELLF